MAEHVIDNSKPYWSQHPPAAHNMCVYVCLDTNVAVTGDLRIGGRDGMEVSASGYGSATGTATVSRTLAFDSKRRLTSQRIEITDVDIDDYDEFDVFDAWIRSLGPERDDA